MFQDSKSKRKRKLEFLSRSRNLVKPHEGLFNICFRWRYFINSINEDPRILFSHYNKFHFIIWFLPDIELGINGGNNGGNSDKNNDENNDKVKGKDDGNDNDEDDEENEGEDEDQDLDLDKTYTEKVQYKNRCFAPITKDEILLFKNSIMTQNYIPPTTLSKLGVFDTQYRNDTITSEFSWI